MWLRLRLGGGVPENHPSILLTTLNASYSHASFGLRYLLANMGPLRAATAIREFTIKNRPLDIAQAILEAPPCILGIGVYIWNVRESLELVSMLKKLRPDMIIVLGGPEVSYETEEQEIVALADYVITGEADLAFAQLCARILDGEPAGPKIQAAALPHFGQIALPYGEYTEEDVRQRVVYVEASRGCPFTCEFCLSSLDIPVRAVPLDHFLPAMKSLIDRGLRQFKFVDRTFNLNINTGRAMLQFFLDEWQDGMFLHFEMIPDRLPEGLRELIAQFPPGALQFEVGIQTFNEEASKNISRRNNHTRTAENFAFLREKTGVHIHADLIVGLPGEDSASFGAGFDRLHALGPQEIQVGMLKRLRGTPIIRHDAAYGMVYTDTPPYEILQTGLIPFAEMQRLRRFSKYWDLIGNSGNFPGAVGLLWRGQGSAYAQFSHLSEELYQKVGATEGIELQRLMRLLFEHLTGHGLATQEEAAATLWADYSKSRPAQRPPQWLAPHLSAEQAAHRLPEDSAPVEGAPKRQRRHLVVSQKNSIPGVDF